MKSFGKVAVICGEGLGDSLIMMIAAHQFTLKGHEVTLFTNHLHSLDSWIGRVSFGRLFDAKKAEETLSEFDTLIVQHENTPRAAASHALKNKKTVFTLYNQYKKGKHAPLDPEHDFNFSQKKPMAESVADAIEKILDLPFPPMDIGMRIPEHLIFRKNKRRVLLHTMSADPIKNWPKAKYIRLAKKLLKEGYHPTIIVSPKERDEWLFAQSHGIDVPFFPQLSDLASLMYESGYFIGNDSGPGHLASYLQIPNIILSHGKSISHWRPAWFQGPLLLPPKWAPNFKGLRLRENRWHLFVSVSKVLNTFYNYKELIKTN